MKTQVTRVKRTKYVYSSSREVFHLWANQSQDSARQGGRITRAFFDGTSCYSYGRHYKVGELVTINGHTVALINRSGYSHTTAKHINEASSAASHIPQINVGGSFDWEKGLVNMQSDLIDGLFNILNRRKFWETYNVFDQWDKAKFTQFNNLCVLVGKPELQLFPDKLTIEILQEHVKKCIKRTEELKAEKETPEYKAKQAKIQATKEAKEAAARAEREAKERAEVEAWKLGGPYTFAVGRTPEPLLRVKDGRLETSWRASVPLSEAQAAYRKLLSNVLKSGEAIGSYTFDKKESNSVTIGCHTISLDEIRRVLGDGTVLRLVK